MNRFLNSISCLMLLCLAPAAAALPPDITYEDGYLQALDGTQLQVQVWRPAGVDAEHPAPVLLNVTPYSTVFFGEGVPYELPAYVHGAWRRGWTYVEVALRGYARSEGCGDLLGPLEASDVVAGATWAATQAWSDGRVVMSGSSYDGWTVLAAAAYDAPIVAGLARAAPADFYSLLYEDGVPTWPVALTYAEGMPVAEGGGRFSVPVSYRALLTLQRSNAPATAPLAYPRCLSEDAYGLYAGANPASAYARARNLVPKLGHASVPILFQQGFQDRNILSQDLGGWIYYGGPKAATFGHFDHQGAPRPDAAEDAMDWLQAHVEGRIPQRPRIIVQDSQGHWRSEERYPPTDVADLTLPIRPGRVVDAADLGPFKIDPAHMALSLTPAFTSLTRFAGQIAIDLAYVPPLLVELPEPGLTARVIAWIYDIAPDGTAAQITRGAAALNSRGQVDLDTEFTDWVIAPGHRLLLALSGTDITAYETYSGRMQSSTYQVLGGHWRVPVLKQARSQLLDGGLPTPVTPLERTTVDLARFSEFEISSTLPEACAGCGPSNAQAPVPLATVLDTEVEIGPAGKLSPGGAPAIVNIPFEVPAGLGPIVLNAVAVPSVPTSLFFRIYQQTSGGDSQIVRSRGAALSLASSVAARWMYLNDPGDELLGPGQYSMELTNQAGQGTSVQLTIQAFRAPAGSHPRGLDADTDTHAAASSHASGGGGAMPVWLLLCAMLLLRIRYCMPIRKGVAVALTNSCRVPLMPTVFPQHRCLSGHLFAQGEITPGRVCHEAFTSPPDNAPSVCGNDSEAP